MNTIFENSAIQFEWYWLIWNSDSKNMTSLKCLSSPEKTLHVYIYIYIKKFNIGTVL